MFDFIKKRQAVSERLSRIKAGKRLQKIKRLKQRSPVFYVLIDLIERTLRDAISRSAAELAYFLLFTFFPLLMFLTALMSRVNLSAEVWITIEAVLPAQIMEVVDSYVNYLSVSGGSSLLYVGLALSLTSLGRAINSLLRTINRLYRNEKPRMGFFRSMASVLFAAAFLVSILLLLVLVVAGQVILAFLAEAIPWFAGHGFVWTILRYGVAIGFVFAVLVVLYYVLPYRKITFREALPGAVFTMAAWMAASVAFSFYVTNMANYSVIYGSLGAIMILMIWLYLMGLILLLGAELNVVLYEMPRFLWKNS